VCSSDLDYHDLIKINPADAGSARELAGVLQQKGKLASALSELDRLVSVLPKEAIGYIWRARLLDAEGRYQEAEKDYSASKNLGIDAWDCLEYVHRHSSAFHSSEQTGDEQFSAGRNALAIQSYRAADSRWRWSARITDKIATAYFFEGKYQKAIQYYDKSLACDESSVNAERKNAHAQIYKGCACWLKGDTASAIKTYRLCLDELGWRNSFAHEAVLLWALALLQNGQTSAANNILAAGKRRLTRDNWLYDVGLFMLGDETAAQVIAAASRHKAAAEANAWIAAFLLFKGRRTEARNAFEESLHSNVRPCLALQIARRFLLQHTAVRVFLESSFSWHGIFDPKWKNPIKCLQLTLLKAWHYVKNTSCRRRSGSLPDGRRRPGDGETHGRYGAHRRRRQR
jgi:tetratricopeptide (TPR) repeat protein